MKFFFKNLIFYTFFISYACFSQINLPFIFSDNLIFQQNSNVKIWGKSNDSKIKIKASWGQESETKVENGVWELYLKTPNFGGPYEIEISSDNDIKYIRNILIGEVWLVSGQSNMQWTFNERIENKEDLINNSDNPNIRMINIPRSLEDNNNLGYKWEISSSSTLNNFSAVGYLFAKNLYDSLKIPIGIINSSWGGTRIEAWMSLDTLLEFKNTKNNATQILKYGSYSDLQGKLKLSHQEIIQTNEKYLNQKSYYFSDPFNDFTKWNDYDFLDIKFKEIDFDDSNWGNLTINEDIARDWSDYSLEFESIYPNNEFAQNGVIWFRKEFILDNIEETFTLNFDGIDDFDFSYINGEFIGKTLSCCGPRTYTIPKNILKKGKNLLSLKIVDFKGRGGLMGNAYLKSPNQTINLSKDVWKYNHDSFFLYPSIQKHSYTDLELKKNGEELIHNLKNGIAIDDPNAEGILFEKMIKPILPFFIRGALWYQGESNVSNFSDYGNLLKGMILNWRGKWKNAFPFLYAQIAPYNYAETMFSQNLREQQRLTESELKDVGMVVLSDIGEKNDIHPANKSEVGRRFAVLALNKVYGKEEIVGQSPKLKSGKFDQNNLILEFELFNSKLMENNNLENFQLSEDGINFYFSPGKVISKNQILLNNPVAKRPKYIRYGWKNYFQGDVLNINNLALSSFEFKLP